MSFVVAIYSVFCRPIPTARAAAERPPVLPLVQWLPFGATGNGLTLYLLRMNDPALHGKRIGRGEVSNRNRLYQARQNTFPQHTGNSPQFFIKVTKSLRSGQPDRSSWKKNPFAPKHHPSPISGRHPARKMVRANDDGNLFRAFPAAGPKSNHHTSARHEPLGSAIHRPASPETIF